MTRQKLNKTRKDSIYWYIDKDKKKKYAYRYKFYDVNGKRREKSKQGFESEVAAERALTELKATILNGGAKIVVNENVTVEQWLDIFFERKKNKWKISSLENYKRIIRLYLKPLLGHYKLSKLTKRIYEDEFVEKLRASKSAKSIELYHGFFMGCINAAVEEEIIPRNKLNKAELPKVPKQNIDEVEGNYLTPKELQELLHCVKKSFDITRYTLIMLLAATGMRRGESSALRWSQLDFTSNCIYVTKTRDFHGERSVKSDNSVRKIEMTATLSAQLERYRRWCMEYKLAQGIIHKDDDFVFISRTCRPLSKDVPGSVLDHVSELYGLKRITPHGLRHTFVTILISQNVPVTSIAKLIGDTPETVMRTYAHSFAENERKAIETLEDTIFGVQSGVQQ